jgi:hypothetical protein
VAHVVHLVTTTQKDGEGETCSAVQCSAAVGQARGMLDAVDERQSTLCRGEHGEKKKEGIK